MRRFFAILLSLLLTAVMTAGCGVSRRSDTWIIAADRDLSPFIYTDKNGKPAGLDADLLAAIAKDQGFRYEIRTSDWNSAVAACTSHQAHVLMGSIASSQERLDDGWFFSQSYFDGVTQSMAMEPGSDTNTLTDLAGKAVAVVSGTLGAAYAESLKDQYGFSVATFTDSTAMYSSVLSGQTAACFEDTLALQNSIQTGVALELVTESESTPTGYCLALRDEDSLPFLELFNRGLENIRANGTYDRIVAKYIP